MTNSFGLYFPIIQVFKNFREWNKLDYNLKSKKSKKWTYQEKEQNSSAKQNILLTVNPLKTVFGNEWIINFTISQLQLQNFIQNIQGTLGEGRESNKRVANGQKTYNDHIPAVLSKPVKYFKQRFLNYWKLQSSQYHYHAKVLTSKNIKTQNC